jgi:tetratricopeptide (TPR) repeat protein
LANIYYNLGLAHATLLTIIDFEEAEQWYDKGLKLLDERGDRDPLLRSRFFSELGYLAYKRGHQAAEAHGSSEQVLGYFRQALALYLDALELTPPSAVGSLAAKHQSVGQMYFTLGDVGASLEHYREAIRYHEVQDNFFEAARDRQGIARALVKQGNYADALLYAQAAVQNFESYGDSARRDLQEAQDFTEYIERHLNGNGR